jgi:hypothetical protein
MTYTKKAREDIFSAEASRIGVDVALCYTPCTSNAIGYNAP